MMEVSDLSQPTSLHSLPRRSLLLLSIHTPLLNICLSGEPASYKLSARLVHPGGEGSGEGRERGGRTEEVHWVIEGLPVPSFIHVLTIVRLTMDHPDILRR